MRRLLCAATSLLLPALVFLGSAMSRLGDGSIHAAASGRSAHEHATVRFGGSFEGSPRSTEQLAPPRAAPSAAPPVRAGAPAASATNANFLKPGGGSKLLFNEAARQQLAPYAGAAGTTVHFTFGSSVMVDFVQNWLHFARRAALKPLLVGAADAALLSFCNNKSVPAAAISPDLDVWTYERKPAKEGVYQIKTQWAYFRHHDSDFLEMGLVKVAFLWELLAAGLNVLISDLDVVWLNGHWARWMAYGGAEPPLPEASLLAAADILVSTDELNAEADLAGRRPSHGSDLNTGVVFLRCTQGSKAMVQAWRQAMLGRKGDKHLNENVNDQSLFQGVVRGAELRGGELDELLRRSGAVDRLGLAEATSTRRVYRALGGPPCLPQERCARSSFTFGTLPMRPFSGGHTWFNQNVQDMAGHEQPRNEPITVHFTFQFGDTGTYPHGKRQRAREAALWAVDPPEYFTEGVFVALDGPTYSEAEQAAVYARFPSWSPQRHMHMDAPQRQAVRDLLGLATAVGGIPVLPSLWCHCDRYWGFLKNCRFPMVPNMNLPFNCPQDALYDPTRWAAKGVRWREHTFLDNPNVPALLRTQTVTVTVAAPGEVPAAAAPDQISLAYGTPLSEVMAAVKQARPGVRVIRIANHHLRRLCRWLGSSQANADFNKLARYILTESSRYCPQEDMGGYGGGSFDWQNPFVAYNCTWGFHYPSPFPDDKAACSATGEQRERSSSAGGLLSSLLPPVNAAGEPLAGADGVNVTERPNSTTCPRIMLCDYNILPDGSMTKPIRWCNIEGYNGMKQDHLPATRAMLAKMPDGRCPYPPGDVPGMPGFDLRGHYIGA